MRYIFSTAVVLGVIWLMLALFANAPIDAGQALAWELPTPIRTAEQFPPMVVGRVTVPVDFGLYVNTYYNMAHAGLDGMSSNFAAIAAAHNDEMERLSAVLDDFKALDPVDYQNSITIHKVQLQDPLPQQ